MSDPQMPDDEARDTRRMKAAFVAGAAVVFAVSAFVSPFEGFAEDAVPVRIERLPLQPAGYAFAIWGPILLWLVAHGLYGLTRRADAADWDAVRWPLMASLVLGAAWLPIATRAPGIATVLIWAMLALALWALVRSPAREERWLLRAPIGLYAGWLTAASCVAAALLAAGLGLASAGVASWAGLAAALAVALAVTRLVRDVPLYAFGVGWALVGVAVANWGTDWGLVLGALGGVAVVAEPEVNALRARLRGRPGA